MEQTEVAVARQVGTVADPGSIRVMLSTLVPLTTEHHRLAGRQLIPAMLSIWALLVAAGRNRALCQPKSPGPGLVQLVLCPKAQSRLRLLEVVLDLQT